MRDCSFGNIPEIAQEDFFDTEDQKIEKLRTLKKMIVEQFPVSFHLDVLGQRVACNQSVAPFLCSSFQINKSNQFEFV